METAVVATEDTNLHELLSDALLKSINRQLDLSQLIDTANRLSSKSLDMAASLYKTWIACNADHPGLHAIYFNYAVCLADSNDLPGAVNTLRETIRLKPAFAPPYINLGGVLERLGQTAAAVEAWSSFVETVPQVTPDAVNYKLLALKQIGRVLELSNQAGAAEDALRHSLELDTSQQDAIQHWIALRQGQCKWPPLSGCAIPSEKLRATISPLSGAYESNDPLFHLATAHNYCRYRVGVPIGPSVARSEAFASENSNERLRVGYVSSDLREHAVGFAMVDVIESHDRNVIKAFVYYSGIESSDAIHQRTRKAADQWTDLTGLDDIKAAQAIRRDQIDILVDLNGYTKDARTKVFAMRPAPIAVNWFGFPGSMGSPYHHYIIADEHVIPAHYEKYYSEKVLRLPCYQPNDRKRIVSPVASTRQDAGLPTDKFVFCCLNGLQKLTASTFDRWILILRQVPESVLWLLGANSETNGRLRSVAQEADIEPTRLIFAEKMHNPEHLARMKLADLFLDTFPYGAHTTASDALWMGLPVLTLKGRSFASRVCASLVSAAGTPEMVCSSPAEYVARAVQLATNRVQLGHIRDRLMSNRESSALFDTPNLVRSLEALYRGMNDDRLNGTLPKPDLSNLHIYHELGASEELDRSETLSDSAYIEQYRDRLRNLDSVFPIAFDSRIWTANAKLGQP